MYPFGQKPAASCDPHAGGQPNFTDETAAWGLADALGTRIVSGDVDGDGYADLLLNRGNPSTREKVGGARMVRLLMNRPAPSGTGRVFVDATEDSGLYQRRPKGANELTAVTRKFRRATHLTILADVDNDGDLDVFTGADIDPDKVAADPGDRSELMLNDGTGHFSFAGEQSPFDAANQYKHTSGASFADVDRDGKIDLFVDYFYASNSYSGDQPQLFRGNGQGGFSAITEAAGMMASDAEDAYELGTNARPAYGATACDLNDDGAADVIVSSYGRQSNQLWLNDGQAQFRDIGGPSGLGADANVSYSDNENFKCYCTINSGEENCQGVAKPRIGCPTPASASWSVGMDDQPWRNAGNTFTSVCADINGDGLMDVYHADIRHWWAGEGSDASALLLNKGGAEPTFERPNMSDIGMSFKHVGSSWDEGAIMAAAADLDNDARQDILVGLSDYPNNSANLFHQNGDGTFEEVANAIGLKHPCVAGMTIVDLDNDGDLDVVMGASRMRDCAALWKAEEVHVYINHAADGGASRSVELRLHGDGASTNSAAIGAKVTVKVAGATAVREVSGGYGHRGMQHGLMVHAGVGNCSYVDQVRIDWPNRTRSNIILGSVPTGAVIDVYQADGSAIVAHAP